MDGKKLSRAEKVTCTTLLETKSLIIPCLLKGTGSKTEALEGDELIDLSLAI